MKRYFPRLIVAATCAAVLAGPAVAPLHATTASAVIAVAATVTNICVVTGGVLTFGSYSPLSSSQNDQQTSILVTCTKGTSATVGLDYGLSASGTTRRLTNGLDYLAYEIYKDTNRTQVWGPSGGSLLSLGAAASNLPQTVYVYGRLTGSQDTTIGAYVDTLGVTVTF